MANRRGIRAPRQNWRRGRRRPSRWIDCNSTQASAGAVGAGSIIIQAGTPAESAAGYRELVVGDIDTEWADANEVLVERVVGDISMSGYDILSSLTDETELLALAQSWVSMGPLTRIGLVVVEDVDDSETSITVPSLFEFDDVQDTEWMWLFQLGSPNETHVQVDETNDAGVRMWTHDLHIDVRVKRKLGRRDRLLLVHEFALRGAAFLGEHSVSVHPLLRCLVTTK